MGDNAKSTQSTDFSPKESFSFLNWRSVLSVGTGVEVSVQIFTLGPCAIAKLQILATPARPLFKICLSFSKEACFLSFLTPKVSYLTA